MPIRKRNEFLDAASSDEDSNLSIDEEGASDSRLAGLVPRSSKRQKLADTELIPNDQSEANDSEDNSVGVPARESIEDVSKAIGISNTATPAATKRKLVARPSSSTHKPGVIYLSRIPPFMRPSTVKTLLSIHGPIAKIFLTPEPPTAYLRRKKGGGNKKHSFIDGWVEFARKKHAKQCIDAINGQTVGGKKGGWYRDDVWNAKYLRGFGWDDLMQGVRAEEREREERVRVGTKREGRERGEFLRNLERSKMDETRRAKRRKREGKEEGIASKEVTEGTVGGDVSKIQNDNVKTETGKRKGGCERRFRQNEVKGKAARPTDQPDEVKRVLSKIF